MYLWQCIGEEGLDILKTLNFIVEEDANDMPSIMMK